MPTDFMHAVVIRKMLDPTFTREWDEQKARDARLLAEVHALRNIKHKVLIRRELNKKVSKNIWMKSCPQLCALCGVRRFRPCVPA